jgi:hypothetical protein
MRNGGSSTSYAGASFAIQSSRIPQSAYAAVICSTRSAARPSVTRAPGRSIIGGSSTEIRGSPTSASKLPATTRRASGSLADSAIATSVACGVLRSSANIAPGDSNRVCA